MSGSEGRRVLVCGDRYWGRRPGAYAAIERRLRELEPDTVVIHGACSRLEHDREISADMIADKVAIRELGLEVWGFPADWTKHGKAAGPIRNRQMLDENPWLVIAFHPDLRNSKGTLDCILEANRRGIPVEIWP